MDKSNLRWIVWSVFAFTFFLSFFHRIAPAVITDYLMADFSVGATVIGGLASVYFYIYLFMQIPTGVLADSIGPRKTIIFGSLVAAAGSLIFAISYNIGTAFLGRFLIGLGVSVAFICTLKIQAIWFKPREFSMMMGFLTLVGTFASISAATPLAFLSEKIGWPPIFIAAAAFSLASAIFCYLLPQENKLEGARTSLRKVIPIVWKNPQTWLCSLIHFAFLGTYLTFTGLWGVPFLMQVHGFERIVAANWMVFFAICYTAGAFFFAALSEHWMILRKRPQIISTVIFVLGILIALLNSSIAIVLIAFSIIWFSTGANVICFATVQELNPKNASGLAMATANGGILCVAILQPLIGYILDLNWNGAMFNGVRLYSPDAYQIGFATFLVVGIVALIASLFIKETHCTRIYDESS